MKIEISKIVEDVTGLLGESLLPECEPAEAPFPGLAFTVSLIAREVLLELLQETPAQQLTGWKPLTGPVTILESGIGEIPLPDDFLRLGSLRLSSWERDVEGLVAEDDQRIAVLTGKWAGIVSSPESPLARMAVSRSGERCLKLYGCEAGDTLEHGWYLPVPDSGTDSLEVAEHLYPAFIRKIALMVAERS